MIYKMTSSKAVIAKVIADLGLNETEIPITDIRQWIGEALMNIGSVNQLVHLIQDLMVLIFKMEIYHMVKQQLLITMFAK